MKAAAPTCQLHLQASDALALAVAALQHTAQLVLQLHGLLLVRRRFQLQLSLPGRGHSQVLRQTHLVEIRGGGWIRRRERLRRGHTRVRAVRVDEELLTRAQPEPVGEVWSVETDGQRERSLLMRDGMD